VRAEALTAPVYDIVPTIAAPHSTSINAITATPDMRWVFSGGADGYIRKFNWVDTANFKLALTVAQRHPFVDSVTKAGVLMSYWENEEGINDYPFRLISWCANTSCRPKHDG
jgi:transcriptional activator SPT8